MTTGAARSSWVGIRGKAGVARQPGQHHMFTPLTVDFQISAQIAFPLETRLLQEPHAPLVLRNTSCFDTVQLKDRKDVGYNQLKCGEHMALAGMPLAHPVADHAAL